MRRFVACHAVRVQHRALSLHEGISKTFLAEVGCRVQYGITCDSIEAVTAACAKIKTSRKVIKAQILAGGRGKGTFVGGFKGGVHLCKTDADVVRVAGEMLGKRLVTQQTGPEGLHVSRVLVAECVDFTKEYYVALVLDRGSGGPVFIASTEGGMDIEHVAEKTPEKIVKMPVPILTGMTAAMGVDLARMLGMKDEAGDQFVRMYNFAKASDALQLEINPFVELEGGGYLCIDAKINVDDNAQFRQPNLWAHEDKLQVDPREAEAAAWDLNYVGLDGNVGCLVNGAGLAMATMDIISMYGGKPANFLDVGGGAKAPQVAAALDIIQRDPKVEAILINIFGGIMKCDTIAQGVIEACRKVEMRVPLVVRLSGTNAELGIQLLKDSKLPITSAADLDEAATAVMTKIKAKA